MTRSRLATLLASVGAGLTSLTGGLHMSALVSVTSQAPADLKPLLTVCWIFAGLALFLSTMIAITATPLFVVRRRAFLWLAALIPLAIALLQIVYMGFIAPTYLLLADALLMGIAGELGRALQPRPAPMPAAV